MNFKHLLLRSLLTVALVVTSTLTWADIMSGSLKNGTWRIDNEGCLHINVSGDMSNFKAETAPWYPYNNKIKKINCNATAIGNYAFYLLTGVTEIKANNATKVGKYAFEQCGSTSTLYLPNVATVDDYGFYNCNCWAICLPNVKTVGKYSFSGQNSSLKYVDLGSKITFIGACAFADNPSMYDENAKSYNERLETSGNPGVFISATTPPEIKPSIYSQGGGTTIYENDWVTIYVPENLEKTYLNSIQAGTTNKWGGWLSVGSLMYDGNHQMIGSWFLGQPKYRTDGMSLCARYFLDEVGIPESHGNKQAPWYSKVSLSSSKHVYLLGNYDAIPQKLLADNTAVQEVYLWPDYITSYVTVGDNAFYGCSSLTTVKAQDGVSTEPFSLKNIGNSAFASCGALTKLPKIQGSIGAKAFYSCSKLNNIDFSEATSIGESAFERCTSMAQMKATSATEIGKRAFYMTRVVDLRMGGSIKTIGNEAFAGRQSAATVLTTNIYMEARQAPSVGTDAFKGFTKAKTILHTSYGSAYTDSPWNGFTLTQEAYPITGDGWKLSQDGILTITKNVPSKASASDALEQNPWMPYLDEVYTILIDNGVTQIGDYAFYHSANAMSRVATVSVPTSLQIIGAHALENHDKLETVFVDNITEMGDRALAGCSSLTRIVFGKQTEKLGHQILAGTPKLQKFDIYTETPPQLYGDTFDDMGLPYEYPSDNGVRAYKSRKRASANRRAVRATVPPKSFVEYVTTPGWDQLMYTDAEHGDILSTGKEYSKNTGEPMYSRRASWILYEDGLLDMSCPDERAGHDMSNTKWYEYADKVKSIVVHDGPRVVSALFNNLPNLKSVSLPESVKVLEHTFYGCSSLETVDFPYVEEIVELTVLSDDHTWEQGTFGNCTSLRSVSLPNAKEIGDDTFQGCTSLTDVEIDADKLGYRVFKNCSSLVEIDLGKCELLPGLFEGCSSLTTVNANGSPSSDCFNGCTSLKTMRLSNKVYSLGSKAFANSGLETIYISTPNPPHADDDSFEGIDLSRITCYVPADYMKMYKISNIWKDMNLVVDESYEEPLIPCGDLIGDYGMWILDETGLLTIDMMYPMPDYDLYKDLQYLSRYINSVLFTDNCTSLEKGNLFPSNLYSENYIRAKELYLGKNITDIGAFKFTNLSYLTDVYCFAETPPTMLDWYGYEECGPFELDWLNSKNTTLHVQMKEGVKEAYESAYVWRKFPNIVADLDVDSAEDYADAIRSTVSKSLPNDEWYTLDGQKLPGRPKKAGVYVVGGHKVVIK